MDCCMEDITATLRLWRDIYLIKWSFYCILRRKEIFLCETPLRMIRIYVRATVFSPFMLIRHLHVSSDAVCVLQLCE